MVDRASLLWSSIRPPGGYAGASQCSGPEARLSRFSSCHVWRGIAIVHTQI